MIVKIGHKEARQDENEYTSVKLCAYLAGDSEGRESPEARTQGKLGEQRCPGVRQFGLVFNFFITIIHSLLPKLLLDLYHGPGTWQDKMIQKISYFQGK